jgi:hypothetical protein
MNHWVKIDHITFLIMLPLIISVVASIFFETRPFLRLCVAILLLANWVIAFAYDLWEHHRDKKSKCP